MTEPAQVHREAAGVLDFWFVLPAEKWWAKDAALDRTIAERFGALRATLKAGGAAGWRDSSDTLLAAIVVLDQFSRNLFRGEAEAFATDDLAVALTLHGIAMGWEERYPPTRRAFFYMPLMHAEDAPLQAMSVEKFAALGHEQNLHYARWHRDVFLRFGRFPGRNAALGRASSPAEEQWLAENDGGW